MQLIAGGRTRLLEDRFPFGAPIHALEHQTVQMDGTPYYDLCLPHETLPRVRIYTQPTTRNRLHAYEVDCTVSADYYNESDLDGGWL